jgi:hypothetical protein
MALQQSGALQSRRAGNVARWFERPPNLTCPRGKGNLNTSSPRKHLDAPSCRAHAGFFTFAFLTFRRQRDQA